MNGCTSTGLEQTASIAATVTPICLLIFRQYSSWSGVVTFYIINVVISEIRIFFSSSRSCIFCDFVVESLTSHNAAFSRVEISSAVSMTRALMSLLGVLI